MDRGSGRYCSRACFKVAWRGGHGDECVPTGYAVAAAIDRRAARLTATEDQTNNFVLGQEVRRMMLDLTERQRAGHVDGFRDASAALMRFNDLLRVS